MPCLALRSTDTIETLSKTQQRYQLLASEVPDQVNVIHTSINLQKRNTGWSVLMCEIQGTSLLNAADMLTEEVFRSISVVKCNVDELQAIALLQRKDDLVWQLNQFLTAMQTTQNNTAGMLPQWTRLCRAEKRMISGGLDRLASSRVGQLRTTAFCTTESAVTPFSEATTRFRVSSGRVPERANRMLVPTKASRMRVCGNRFCTARLGFTHSGPVMATASSLCAFPTLNKSHRISYGPSSPISATAQTCTIFAAARKCGF